MALKVAVGIIVVLLAVETSYILIHRRPLGRFRTVSEDAFVAFDTATGQLCKTLRTRSVAEIEQQEADAAKKLEPCPPLPPSSGDPVIDEIRRKSMSKRCGGSGEDATQKSEADSTLEFAAKLPACTDIR